MGVRITTMRRLVVAMKASKYRRYGSTKRGIQKVRVLSKKTERSDKPGSRGDGDKNLSHLSRQEGRV